MTKEEILAMEADDELNALVAEHIMEDDLEHQWEEGPSRSGVKYCGRCNTYDWMPGAERPCSVKLYSEDISAAWQVVEKLIEQNLFRSLDYLREQHWRDGKGALRCRVVCGVKIEFAVAKAAPEAICKAALLAKLKV